MKVTIKQFIAAAALLHFSAVLTAQNFEIIPLYDIRVNSELLTYSGIAVETPSGAPIVRNEIPQEQEFSVVVQKPEGFRDSAGWVLYGLEYTLQRESGEVVMHTDDIFKKSGMAADTSLSAVSLTNTFNAETKAGTKLVLKARLYDRNGKGWISFQYVITVVSGSKRLPVNSITYYEKDSRGMRSTSVGLHFNFFEFKGLEGNLFLYKINKGDALNINLKGMDGWRVTDGKVSPEVDMEITDVAGMVIESATDITAKSIGQTMSPDKKELSIGYDMQNKLPSGQFYYANFKIRDRNSKKSGMGVVVKFFVED